MKRDRIIETASRLFETYGIKTVSMDDIASQVGVSKKTVYEVFRDKGEIVFECVRSNVMQCAGAIEKAETEAGSPLEVILRINIITLRQAVNRCPSFFRDLDAYPEARLQEFDKYVSLVGSKYIKLFHRGIHKGQFFPATDMNMLLDFFAEQIRFSTDKYHTGNSNVFTCHFNVVKTFLRGVCTEKGHAELSKYNVEQFINQ